MIEPANIDNILNILGICDESKMHDTPANIILIKDETGTEEKRKRHYCSVIGQMNCLAGTIRPDIIFAMH